MDRRFAARREQILADAEAHPAVPRGALPRLGRFLDPFVASLRRSEQARHARRYVAGLLSDLESKNTESIAYLHGQPREPLQQFIGQSPWDHQPWLAELARQVGRALGSPDGVLVFDPSAFPKKRAESVGVQRQWCGRLGKVDNCQVGVYLAYVGRTEPALVDVRLYRPKEWARDCKRRAKTGVPKAVRCHTRHELALQVLDERGPLLPHAWVAGDDDVGRQRLVPRAVAGAGRALPTQTGNLIVTLPGTRPGPRLLFSTHLDTVPLAAGAVPVRAGKRITPRGRTALGGDNRTGCACLVTLAATLLQQQLPHPPITLLFTVREESGLFGARYLDPKDLGSHDGTLHKHPPG
jgi:hypothetical protein